MTTWAEYHKTITAIPQEELQAIDSLAYLHATQVKQGISQKELAERIGMKQAQLSKIEQLDSIPSLKTLDRYARGLGLVTTILFRPADAVG